MKVLVATREGQGERQNDFSWTREGEFVKFGTECESGSVDDECGCRRDMVGFDTSKGTTTFKVIEVNISKDRYTELLEKSEKRDSYPLVYCDKDTYARDAEQLLDIASNFPVNVVLEKRGDKIQTRADKSISVLLPPNDMLSREAYVQE